MGSTRQDREPTKAPTVRTSSRLAFQSRVARVLAPVGIAVCAAFLIASLARNWATVESSIAHADVALLAASFATALAAMSLIAVVWTDVIRAIGGSVRRVRTIAWYFAGEAGKYVPGGVWSVVGRGELATRGVGRSVAYRSVAVSLLLLYGVAAVITAASLPFRRGAATADYVWALAVLPLLVAALHPRTAAVLGKLVHRISGRRIAFELPRWRASLRLASCYVPAWVLISATTFLAARALGYHPSPLVTAQAAIVSWLVGFVFVPAPGGVGVREACFIALSDLSAGKAAAVSVVARICFIGADAVGAALAAWWLRRDAVRRRDGTDDAKGGPPARHSRTTSGGITG